MTLPQPPYPGLRLNMEPVARSSKPIESNSKCQAAMHCLFHLLLIAAALGVVYWGLVLGRVFLPKERDYDENPVAPLFRPPPADEPSES